MTSKLNIYEHLTPDAAARCQKIGHLFSPLDMAVIVQHSGKTVRDKLAAWQTIIDGCPDMPIGGNGNFKPRKSLHEYLKWWIAQHERWITEFYADCEGKAVFRPYLRTDMPERDEEVGGCYSTIGKAFCAVKKDAFEKVALGMERKHPKIKIVKETIDEEGDSSALFDSKGELLGIYDLLAGPGDDCELDSIFIHVPVPFKKGDIVTDGSGRPMVLVGCTAWDKDWCDGMLAANGLDGTDMSGLAFAAESFFGNPSAHEHPETLELRYYTKELQGRDRFLKAFSEFVKDLDREADSYAVHLIAAYRMFQAEADAKRLADACWDEWFK